MGSWLKLIVCAVAAIVAFPLVASADDIVPNVLGLTAADAKKALESEKYKMKDGGGLLSTFKIDTVAKQDPAGGTKVKKEGEVLVYFSKGIWLRDYKSADVNAVVAELKTIGIEPDLVPDAATGVPKGIIVDQVPPALQRFDASATKVKLLVATGPTIPVPDVKGRSVSAAQHIATQSKLKVTVAPGFPDKDEITGPSPASPGKCSSAHLIATVVTMSPAPGTLAFANAVITVTTKKQIGEPTPPEPCKCTKNICVYL